MFITVVPNEYLGQAWKLAEPLLSRAIDILEPRVKSFDVLRKCVKGEYQLWLCIDDSDDLLSAACTEIVEDNGFRTLVVRFLAGEKGRIDEWVGEALAAVEKYGKENGCGIMEAHGRDGFRKILGRHGFNRTWSVFEKNIDKETP